MLTTTTTLRSIASTSRQQLQKPTTTTTVPSRTVSTSPYGRTHVWKRRLPTLPNPVVPKYPQTIIRSDGTSFVQWTTSPKSLIRLTRDTTNNPVWNTASWASERSLEEESGSAGRMGRFSRRFGGVSAGKEEKEREKKEVRKAKEDVVDLGGGSGVSMSAGMGMGGALDDVKWFEEMADLTGTSEKTSVKGKKKEKK